VGPPFGKVVVVRKVVTLGAAPNVEVSIKVSVGPPLGSVVVVASVWNWPPRPPPIVVKPTVLPVNSLKPPPGRVTTLVNGTSVVRTLPPPAWLLRLPLLFTTNQLPYVGSERPA